MIKTRLGLFSGVILMAVGIAHSSPQLAVAQAPSGTGGAHDSVDLQQAHRLSQSNDERIGTCVSDPPLRECFGGFQNNRLANAELMLQGNMLEVSNLDGNSPMPCTPPVSGDEIVLSNEDADDQAHTAGRQGFRLGMVDTEIPTDTMAFYTELEGYWGTNANMWNTDPIPIGFTENTGTITACANFNVDPIFCSHVLVEFKGGEVRGNIICPAGDLFRVLNNEPIILQEIVARATCPGRRDCSEIEARERAELEYRFKNAVTIHVDLGEMGCSIEQGPANGIFLAKTIIIKPYLATCMSADPGVSSQGADRAIDAPVSRGGNTPPIRSVKLLAAANDQANGARAPGDFTIRREAIGSIPTVGTWGLVVMVQLVLVAGTVVFRRRLPIFS